MKIRRFTPTLLLAQSLLISATLFWFVGERQTNPFFETWLSKNMPRGRIFLQGSVVTAVSIFLFATDAFLILRSEKHERQLPGHETYRGPQPGILARVKSRLLGFSGSLPRESFYLFIAAFFSLGFSVVLERA